MGMAGKYPVKYGAEKALADENTPAYSEGAAFIVEEAMREDSRTLYIACMGAITNVADAILMEPAILKKNIRIVWIGGGNYPKGRWEYNLKNDIHAANVVFKSGIDVWQVPRNVYRMMPVSLSEMQEKVYPCGEIGKYLTDNVIEFNNADVNRPTEYRNLGDSPSIGIMMYEDAGSWEEIKRPTFHKDMTYNYDGDYGMLRVYTAMNSRFILEDMYAKLNAYRK